MKELTSGQKQELSRINVFEGEGVGIEVIGFIHTDKGVEASTWVQAPGRGDEAMVLLSQELQALANRFRIVFIHVGNPKNRLSKNLLARTAGYEKVFDDEIGSFTWRKEFHPE